MKRIVIVSTSRADEGHLAPLVLACASDDRFRTSFLALSSSPSQEIIERVNSTAYGAAEQRSVPLPQRDVEWGAYLREIVSRFETSLERPSEPKDELILILLGDRLEMLSIAAVAVARRIPIVHIHGGESSFGSTDDSVRHALSKLSSFHFPSTKSHARHLELLGESSERIRVCGALAVDTVGDVGEVSDGSLSNALGYDIPAKFGLATFHPPTNVENFEDELHIFTKVLRKFPSRLILSAPNHDPGSSELRSVFAEIVDSSSGRITFHENLGFETYVRLMRRASLVIGNSSSGLIEAPIVGVPSIDIGARQEGREAPQSVVRVGLDFEIIMSKIGLFLDEPPLCRADNFYGSPGVAHRMLEDLNSSWDIIQAPKRQIWQAVRDS